MPRVLPPDPEQRQRELAALTEAMARHLADAPPDVWTHARVVAAKVRDGLVVVDALLAEYLEPEAVPADELERYGVTRADLSAARRQHVREIERSHGSFIALGERIGCDAATVRWMRRQSRETIAYLRRRPNPVARLTARARARQARRQPRRSRTRSSRGSPVGSPSSRRDDDPPRPRRGRRDSARPISEDRMSRTSQTGGAA